jgi:hypothetical protein
MPTRSRLEVRGPHRNFTCCSEIHFQLKQVKSCTILGPTESFKDCWRYMLKANTHTHQIYKNNKMSVSATIHNDDNKKKTT